MGDRLEKTDVAQSHHDRVTGEIPIVVSDSERLDMLTSHPRLRELIDEEVAAIVDQANASIWATLVSQEPAPPVTVEQLQRYMEQAQERGGTLDPRAVTGVHNDTTSAS